MIQSAILFWILIVTFGITAFSVGITLAFYLFYKKTIIIFFMIILIGHCLDILSIALELFPGARWFTIAYYLVNGTGTILMLYGLPFFFHYLLGIKPGRKISFVYYSVICTALLVFHLFLFFTPINDLFYRLYSLLEYAPHIMLLYVLFFSAVYYRTVANPFVRKVVLFSYTFVTFRSFTSHQNNSTIPAINMIIKK